jgi:outer membrane protein assembly factor BamE (lipoprotein component of BamABCDE complex)
MKAILARLRLAALLGTALTAAACAPTVSTHGHRLDPELVAQIQPGVTSREEVAQLLGSPSSMSTFDDKSWYYVTQRTEQLTFYDENVAAQDVLRIDFGADGLVSNVSQRGLEMARTIEPAPETTRTLGNELTVVQQFIGNIGRFNTEAAGPGSAGQPRAPGR